MFNERVVFLYWIPEPVKNGGETGTRSFNTKCVRFYYEPKIEDEDIVLLLAHGSILYAFNSKKRLKRKGVCIQMVLLLFEAWVRNQPSCLCLTIWFLFIKLSKVLYIFYTTWYKQNSLWWKAIHINIYGSCLSFKQF